MYNKLIWISNISNYTEWCCVAVERNTGPADVASQTGNQSGLESNQTEPYFKALGGCSGHNCMRVFNKKIFCFTSCFLQIFHGQNSPAEADWKFVGALISGCKDGEQIINKVIGIFRKDNLSIYMYFYLYIKKCVKSKKFLKF
jgi:hypothetical protein